MLAAAAPCTCPPSHFGAGVTLRLERIPFPPFGARHFSQLTRQEGRASAELFPEAPPGGGLYQSGARRCRTGPLYPRSLAEQDTGWLYCSLNVFIPDVAVCWSLAGLTLSLLA